MTEVSPRSRPPREIEYPTSDGKPMAETDKHRDLGVYAIEAIKMWFRDRPDVYVAGNNFVYFVEGEPRKVVSPDLYVVFGVAMRQRDCYKAWEEGHHLPQVVFEFTSKKTRREDQHTKLPLYENVLRVDEYFQFDPTGDYLRPRLQGFRLEDGHYVPLELVDGRLYSRQLELELVQEGERLRFYDPKAGRWLLTYEQEHDRAAAEAQRAANEAQRAEAEARRAETAEAEAERLRAEIEALRKQLRESGGSDGS